MRYRREVSPEIKKERRDAVKATLKSMIVPMIFFLIIGVLVFIVITFQNPDEVNEVVPVNAYDGTEKEVYLENDYLKLTLDTSTTQFVIEDKKSGAVWRSNPENADSDSLALDAEKGRLNSLLLLVYSTQTGLDTTYDTYNYSTKNGIYEIEATDDSIRVNYSLGKVEKTFVLPTVMKLSEYNEWMALLEVSDANLFSNYYKKYDINNLGKKDDKEELLANYPILETEPIVVQRDGLKDGMKKTLQDRLAEVGYTYEDYIEDQELDMSAATNDNIVFNVSIEYSLDGDDLIVNVPFDSLDGPSDYAITSITPLPYFGAGGTDENGYLFVPEGGGGLINFNNGRTTVSNYYANLYGWDMAVTRDSVVHNTRAYFNVFGISKNDHSFICMMEDGNAYASVQADISGKTNSYNYVNAVYTVSPREQYDVGEIANSAVYKYFDYDSTQNVKLRYSFVDSDDYVDMAKDYGEYLKFEYGDYLTLQDHTSTPVEVEIIGAVDKVKQILGVPVSKPLELTDFDEAADIVETLTDEGFDNLSVKLSGWCNGGVNQHVLERVSVLSELGGKKDLKSLSKTCEELSVPLYLNGVTQYAYDSDLLDGFFSYTDAAKLISKERAELYEYSHVTYAQREGTDSYYLLHASKASEYVDKLVKTADKYGAGVSFEDMGMDLSADYYVKNPTRRENAKLIQAEAFKNLADSGKDVMINMGNDYAIAYVDFVTNMDLRGSVYTILDEEVPFYQLAIHGYVSYAGNPVNISGDDTKQVLIAAEYGAGLSFTLMDESAFALQKTLYSEYYGSDFDSWHDRMVEIYERYNSELGHIFNQEMTGHDNLSDFVSLTTYADGTKVYVNYSYDDETVNGVTVPARDYLVVK